jgi:Spy/CpxP family protein refolding chaperone
MKVNRRLGWLVIALAGIGTGVAVAAAATTDSTTSTTASAAHAGHWRHHASGSLMVGALLRATKQLDLTTDQQASIKTLVSNARAQHKANAGSSPVDLGVLANPGDPNYATAVQNAKSLAADRIQQESDLASQIYNVLTADQKAKLPSVLADMKAKFQQRRAQWQQHGAATSSGTESAGSN